MPRCACGVLRQSDYVSGHVIDIRPMNEFPSTCGILTSLSDIFEVAGTLLRRNPLCVACVGPLCVACVGSERHIRFHRTNEMCISELGVYRIILE
jgi:hypothetical protein